MRAGRARRKTSTRCQWIPRVPVCVSFALFGVCSLALLVPSLMWVHLSFDEEPRAQVAGGSPIRIRNGSTFPRASTDSARPSALRGHVASDGVDLDKLYDAPAPTQAVPAPRKDEHGLLAGRRAVVVIMAHDNADDLTRCLQSLARQGDDLSAFAVAVSMDDPGFFERLERAASLELGGSVLPWRMPNSAMSPIKNAVSKIASHFHFALTESFERRGYEFAIFVESDLTLSPDFLWYFRKTAWLLEEDPSLFCISAWNDNGFQDMASDERRLYRTDYFPGLGWMIHKDTWSTISGQWPRFPSTGWDHWMRHGSGLRPRECIAPEMPRVRHVSEHGTNVKKGSPTAKLIARMVQSSLASGRLGDVAYLIKDRYDEHVRGMLHGAEIIAASSLGAAQQGRKYIVPYVREEYTVLAKKLQLYPSQPRTSHRGLIVAHILKTDITFLLVDRRQAQDILPEHERWQPHLNREIGKATPAESCSEFCIKKGMRCVPREFEWVNNCDTLRSFFPCEDGCGHQVGQEIPCYVHDASRDTAKQCLITDEVATTCEAKHASTTRLCVCVPAI